MHGATHVFWILHPCFSFYIVNLEGETKSRKLAACLICVWMGVRMLTWQILLNESGVKKFVRNRCVPNGHQLNDNLVVVCKDTRQDLENVCGNGRYEPHCAGE